MQKMSIIIVNHNGARVLKSCLSTLQANTEPDYEIIVVDCGSTDDSLKVCLQQKVRLLSLPRQKESIAAGNFAVKIANGDALFFMKPEMRVRKGWLKELMRTLYSEDEIGIVNVSGNSVPKQTGDAAISSETRSEASDDDENDGWDESEDSFGCMLVKKEVYRRLGDPEEGLEPPELAYSRYKSRAVTEGFRTVSVSGVVE